MNLLGPLPAVHVSREIMDRLHCYAALLRHWSRTLNLVSPSDLDQLWDRHINDCLQALPLLPPACVCADLGSGAGLPGLVLAIASNCSMHLVEADKRKASFLREAARHCEAAVTVHAARSERVILPPIQIILARALAPLPTLIPLAIRHLAPSGSCVFFKGRGADTELAEASASWIMRVQRWRSRTDPNGFILQIGGIAPYTAYA